MFFDRFKKKGVETSAPAPGVNPRPVAVDINVDNALPPQMEGQVPPEANDVKEEEYETYEDDEEDSQPVEQEQTEEENNEGNEDNVDEEEDEEVRKLKEQAILMEKKIVEVKKRKLEEKQRREQMLRQTPLPPSELQEPQYVPIYLSEGELLREILKRIQGLESWAVQLTNYLKGEKR